MTVEIRIPFDLDVNGNVAVTSDEAVQSEQHVASIVTTFPGERVMLPTYGIPLKTYLFEPGADIVTQQVVLDVRNQMAQWEPGLIVTDIIPIPSDDIGLATVDVNWENTPDVSAATTNAVVQVGGTVTPE
jgi:Bacteriophage baseplate protein W